MANQTQQQKSPMSMTEVRDAINRGDFKIEDLLNSIAGEKAYVRAGNAYRELIRESGASFVNGHFALCYRLGDKINSDGSVAPKRPRKKKTA